MLGNLAAVAFGTKEEVSVVGGVFPAEDSIGLSIIGVGEAGWIGRQAARIVAEQNRKLINIRPRFI